MSGWGSFPLEREEVPLTRDALRGFTPRSWKRRPDPATRSLTVLDTSTSPGPAAAATRAPMWTARPETLSRRSSTSPVCSPGPDLEPERTDAVGHRAGAANPSRGPIEGGQEPIARDVDLAAPEAAEFAADEFVVPLEEVAPAAIPEGGRLLRGPDDVSKKRSAPESVASPVFMRPAGDGGSRWPAEP